MEENKSIEPIIKILLYLNKVKFVILPFTIIGLLLGIYTSPNEDKILYVNKGIINCHIASSESISIMLMSLNDLNLEEKSKQLKMPQEILSNLVEIRATCHVIKETTDATKENQIVKFEFYYYSKKLYPLLAKSIENFINSSEYVDKKLKEYKRKRAIKSSILVQMNNELKMIDARNTNEKLINQLPLQSNADFYKLKLILENDLAEPLIKKIKIEESYRQIIGSGDPKNILFHIASFTLLGCILSIILLKSIDFTKLIIKHLKLKNEN